MASAVGGIEMHKRTRLVLVDISLEESEAPFTGRRFTGYSEAAHLKGHTRSDLYRVQRWFRMRGR